MTAVTITEGTISTTMPKISARSQKKYTARIAVLVSVAVSGGESLGTLLIVKIHCPCGFSFREIA